MPHDGENPEPTDIGETSSPARSVRAGKTGLPSTGNPKSRRACLILPRLTLSFRLPDDPITIADMADLFGVTHRTLHFYEEKGLIVADRAGTMRIYRPDHIRLMALISACRETGMTIATIEELLADLEKTASEADADALFQAALERRRREMTADMSELTRQMHRLQSLMRKEPVVDAAEGAPPSARAPPSAHMSGVPPAASRTEPPAGSAGSPAGSMAGSASTAGSQRAPPLLDERERQCLILIAEGHSVSRTARALDMDEAQFEGFEAGILEKLKATNRFQAVAKAILLGILQN